jgi:hypothetical protein
MTVLKNVVGSKNLYAPCLVGDIITEMLQSNLPLAEGYRRWKQQQRSVEPVNIDEYGG